MLHLRLVQFQPEKDKAKNLKKAIDLASSQDLSKRDILLFPELFTTGYQLENSKTLAEEENGETLQTLLHLAKTNRIHILTGSIAFRNQQNQISNTSFILSPEGIILGHYSKIHLFSLMHEKQYFSPGQHTFIFEVNQHRCGTLICYDLRFPELSRKLALQGAEVLFFPMEWPHPRTEIFRTLLKARAIENQCFVVGNNICGTGFSPGLRFEGKSAVFSPYGEILGELGENEGILDVSLDFNLVKKCREQISCFPDRRPELYGSF